MSLTVAPGAPGARILGMGHYRPANVISNADLIARGVDTDDEWIKSRVGIAERHWADEDETVIDMAEAAGSKALANSGVAASEIDLVLVATCTMPTPVPAAAPNLAYRLGIDAPGAFDISSGCSGFVYSVSMALAAIRAGQARKVLVVASERFSGWLDMNDRSTCIILGDGAGAAVIGASDEIGIAPAVLGTAGNQMDTVVIDPLTRTFRQEGQAVYRWATGSMPKIAKAALDRAGIAADDLAAFVPHQANLRIIESIAKKLAVPGLRVAEDIVTSGNTSAASIPLAMSRMLERGEIPSGEPVLLLGYGSGLAYAGQVVLAP
ncbi:MAG TPA: beta-ketoacyl-ACP synthase III [Jatrophihabitans sp.]|jgi:3-oxoacyl-[acyl-carrier-protein] synthase-3